MNRPLPGQMNRPPTNPPSPYSLGWWQKLLGFNISYGLLHLYTTLEMILRLKISWVEKLVVQF
jgi:hypothetical protein